MPKRSNEFQKLVTSLQSHVDHETTVRESEFLPSSINGKGVEVDVVVSRQVGGQKVVVSFECRARKRVDDVTWVREMWGKHQHLPTGVLVLVSKSGFSKDARQLAERHDIRLMALEDVSSSSVNKLFQGADAVRAKMWRFNVKEVLITVTASDDLPSEHIKAQPDQALFFDDGTPIGSAEDLANALRCHPEMYRMMYQDAGPEHRAATYGWNWPAILGRAICLQKLGPSMLRRIEKFEVIADCVVDTDEITLQRGKLGPMTIAWGSTKLLGTAAMLLGSEDPDGRTQVSLMTKDGVSFLKKAAPLPEVIARQPK